MSEKNRGYLALRAAEQRHSMANAAVGPSEGITEVIPEEDASTTRYERQNAV